MEFSLRPSSSVISMKPSQSMDEHIFHPPKPPEMVVATSPLPAIQNSSLVEGNDQGHNSAQHLPQTPKEYACDKLFKSTEGAALYHRNALRLIEDREFAKAKEEFMKALAVDPRNGAVLSDLGTLHYFQQNHDQAVSCYEESLKINPKHAGTLYNLASIHYMDGDTEKAKSMLQQCIEIQSEHASAIRVLADLMSQEGKTSEAEELRNRLPKS
jgi:tetratricopeptide (TPR) repeat protein